MLLRSFLFIALMYCIMPVASAQKQDYKAMAADVLKLVNKHRAEKGLKPLVMNNTISHIAEEHSRNMGDKKVPFSHDGMNERVQRAAKELKMETTSWAENIASGQRDAAGAVAMWLTSQGHRENMEGDFNLTGIGIAKGKNGSLYFTQIFMNANRK